MKLYTLNLNTNKFGHPIGRVIDRPTGGYTLGWSVFKSALEGRMFIPICNTPPRETNGNEPKIDCGKPEYHITLSSHFGHIIWTVTYKCPMCSNVNVISGSIFDTPEIDTTAYCIMMVRKYLQNIITKVCPTCVGEGKIDLNGVKLDGSFVLFGLDTNLQLQPKELLSHLPQDGLFYFQANNWLPEKGILDSSGDTCTAERLNECCFVRMTSNIIESTDNHVMSLQYKTLNRRNWLVQLKPNHTLTFVNGSTIVSCCWDGFKPNTSVTYRYG